MPAQPQISISAEEAEAFAHRLGLQWLAPEGIEQLREAMAVAVRAGLAVPRVSSKFDQPAPVFSVPRGSAG